MHWMRTSPPHQCRNFLRSMDEFKLRYTFGNEIGWCARPRRGGLLDLESRATSRSKFSQTSASYDLHKLSWPFVMVDAAMCATLIVFNSGGTLIQNEHSFLMFDRIPFSVGARLAILEMLNACTTNTSSDDHDIAY